MPAEVNWISEDEIKGANAKWIEKFKAKDFSGSSKDDVILFFKATLEFQKMNADYGETVADTILQYGEIVQYYEVRDTDIKLLLVANDKGGKIGTYTGNWKEIQAANNWKNPCQMEMIADAMKQIMSGNPNTDSFFFAGTLTVSGPIKLAVIGREWITSYYEENGLAD
nr:SCP2 sterol-binding domain-containing protein [Candidatus Sigynarchaeum springense]